MVPLRTRRQNRTSAFVDIVAVLAELPLDDALAIVKCLDLMRANGTLPIVFADDHMELPPPPPPIPFTKTEIE